MKAVVIRKPEGGENARSSDRQGQASSSSFYAGMRVLPERERKAMYDVYGFCRAVDDIADDLDGSRADRLADLNAWRDDLEALFAGRLAGQASFLADSVTRFDLSKADFVAVIDGMQMDVEQDICAPDAAVFDLYVDRVASAVGRLSVRIFGMEPGPGLQLAHHLGRALQLTNILRDLDEDARIGRLYVPREILNEAGVMVTTPGATMADPRLSLAADQLAHVARAEFAKSRLVLKSRPIGRLIAPRLMAAVYSRILAGMSVRGWAPPRTRVKISKAELLWMVARHGFLG